MRFKEGAANCFAPCFLNLDTPSTACPRSTSDACGGLGDAVNQVVRPDLDIQVLACLHSNYPLNLIKQNVNISQNNLKNLFQNLNYSLRKFSSPFIGKATTLALTTLLLGCITPCKNRHAIQKTIEEEIVLLESLKGERQDSKFLKQIHADATTSTAEVHLRDALEVLLDANRELKRTFKSEQHGE